MKAVQCNDMAILWELYKGQDDECAREKIIMEYCGLVKYVASRLMVGLPNHVEMDDLVSYGIFGLIDAVSKFDLTRGIKFETYAIARIRGAILDGLRSTDWVPPSARQRAKELEAAYTTLERRLGRPPEDEETAEYMGLSLDEYLRRVTSVSAMTLMYLEDVWFEGDDGQSRLKAVDMIPDDSIEDPISGLQMEETKNALSQAIEHLPQRERLVITLYYYEGLTVKEISNILSVTASRVSQIHTRAILRLRGKLQLSGEDLEN